jgi:ATPase family associated with various cellular activities (AAA)
VSTSHSSCFAARHPTVVNMDDFDFDELTAMAENEGGGGYEEYEEDEEAEAAMREAEGLPSTAKPAAAAVQPAAKAPALPEKSYCFVSSLRRAPISEADEIAQALSTEGLRHRLSPHGVAAVKAHGIPDWRRRSTAVAAALSAPTAAPLRTAVDQNLAALAGAFSTRSQVICAAAGAAAAVLDRPPVESDCIGCVTGDGTKAFLELLPAEELDLEELRRSKARGSSSASSSSAGLLQCPIEELLHRVEVRQIERTSRALAAAAMQQNSTTADDDAESNSLTKQQQQQPREGRLWVDKYAPSGFSQLLSDERINREVLRAVKAWDSFVFGTAATAAAAAAAAATAGGIENRASSAAAQSASKKLSSPRGRSAFGSGFGSKYSGNKLSTAAARKSPHKDSNGVDSSSSSSGVREDRRPASRVLLLCGPPGMGKTTLAHIVAKQAGYRALEINASDDRTAAVLKDKVCCILCCCVHDYKCCVWK